ncbi:basement membrane-specific heparan sulfate proteoglycan core protein-like isoform X3 [Dreissena polymorpha]|uniref:basement membrane-specific heparan sulfate proteoglycan core protein-like isoform X3 n=1 Tax=Dreissena polymorpha TaxID=45954 RepID=UPI002265418F|nr:basement membrane-specific heparan sulfate proteoglycan core protein-like isoform X3 [Dreissena polymorpha]
MTGPRSGLWTLLFALCVIGSLSLELEKDFEFAGEKAAQLSDDEDLLADQEGSGDTEGSGEAPISRETVTPVLSGKPLGVPTLYRAKVNVTSLSFTVEIQSARAERRLSSLAITLQLENAINTLLASRLRGQIRCRIVDYEPGSLIAVFDIDTDGSQSEDEIAAVLKGSLRSGLLNGYSVSPEGFQFSRVRTGTAECSATVGRQAVAQPRRAANTNAHLMVTNTFPCRGFVISWNYSSVDTSRGYIGIFREMSETEFTLVDYTAVTPGSVGPQRVVLTKPILVENGDFIGIFYDVGARGSIGMIDSDTRVSPDARPDLYSTYQLSASTSDFTNGTFRVADISTTEMLSAFAVQAEMSYANVPEPTTPAVTECTSQQYRCRSGECIPGEFRCDNQFDCADGSDEEDGCVNSGSSQECKEKEFRCRNSGQCIAQDLVCDSVDDCGDNSDEEVIDCGPGPVLITSYKDSSSPTAYTLSWTRPRGNTTVNSYTLKWRKVLVLDGRLTQDGSYILDRVLTQFRDVIVSPGQENYRITALDPASFYQVEIAAVNDVGSSVPVAFIFRTDTAGCEPGQFQCSSGGCISIDLLCDSNPDCPDDSDETADCGTPVLCPEGTVPCALPNNTTKCQLSSIGCDCLEGEFQCVTSRKCIAGARRCDTRRDCPDGSDEAKCPCPVGTFTCVNTARQECVDERLKCDKSNDCTDGSDELGCPKDCGPNLWQCRDQSCVPASMRCDGLSQCEDGSDELECRKACRSDEFTCRDGNCVQGRMRCDGIPQCEDRSDEEGCKDDPPVANAGVDITERYRPNLEITLNGSLSTDDKAIVRYVWSQLGADGALQEGPVIRVRGLRVGQYEFSLLVQDARGQTNTDRVRVNIVGCRGDQYTCADGNCVEAVMRCDGRPQCEDGSDEVGCPTEPPVCPPSDFQCTTVRGIPECIDLALQCDGNIDCTNGFDEENCPGCPKNSFECESDGQCIPEINRCDGNPDCQDRSDELGCVCTSEQFRCGDGSCIPLSRRCDRRVDCNDRSDELACPCRSGEFQCLNGDCVPESDKCNGRYECRDRSDENNCPPRRLCPEGYFQCGTGHCLSVNRHCDFVPDCPDQSDEKHCPLRCRSGEMECVVDNKCIPREQICNRVYDCSDTRDELNCSRCRQNEFQCESNRACISLDGRCNGLSDCSDGSDERGCPTRAPITISVSPRQLRIRAGAEALISCMATGLPANARVEWSRTGGLPMQSAVEGGKLMIPVAKTMDSGDYVCRVVGVPGEYSETARLEVVPVGPPPNPDPDTAKCGRDEAVCQNGQCIRREYRCDGERDCADGSDEPPDCYNNLCEPNEFQCPSGQCVMKIWRCDGETDCDDGFDEANCKTKQPDEPCGTDEFQCVSGDQCLPLAYQCDQEIDCLDRSDEIGCTAPIITVPPVAEIEVELGGMFTIVCEAVGVPTPLIVWRLNWGNIPSGDRVTVVSEAGRGVLTVKDARYEDAGAYTCEAINTRGSIFAIPDALVIVTRVPGSCSPPFFNSIADRSEQCLRCFCFGHTIQCFSSELNVSRISLVNRLQFVKEDVAGGRTDPIDATLVNYRVNTGEHEVLDISRNLPAGRYYWKLPREFLGDRLTSYGGELKYTIFYEIGGREELRISDVDVVLKGNGITLFHRAKTVPKPGVQTSISVQLIEGVWERSDKTERRGDTPVDSQYADRADLMMALADVEYILIRGKYDRQQTTSRIGGVSLTTAVKYPTELGQAYLVEECTCPTGYTGLSCQTCADGFTRVKSGPYLGQCVACNCNGHSNDCDPYTGQCLNCRHNTQGPNCQLCQDGYYGDARTGTPDDCKPCPCPLTEAPNQFSRTCYLDTDRQVTCAGCPVGYEGRRCEVCSRDYIGNPLTPGSTCKKKQEGVCDLRGSVSSQPNPLTGNCICKKNVDGVLCDRCKPNSFYLSSSYELGCVKCFCMGVSEDCQSTSWNRAQVSVSFSRDSSGVQIADMLAVPLANQQVAVDRNTRELTYRGQADNETLFWSLPPVFLGDKVHSYGGALRFTLNFRSTSSDPIVKISGNDIDLLHRGQVNVQPGRPVSVAIMMYEQNWFRVDGQPATREHLLMALADLKYILIQARYNRGQEPAGLRDVSLDIAEDRVTQQERAFSVEQCRCPVGYKGLSCEDCDVGYTRSGGGIYLGLCVPCTCNGHSTDCNPDDGTCRNCQHNTAGDHCELCAVGYYGDATRGTRADCQKCPCPLTEAPNQFSPTCQLIRPDLPAQRGGVRCTACPAGHTGLNCETCVAGYTGNPLKVGDYCKQGILCDCDQRGTVPNTECDQATKQCQCKPFVQGRDCARCREGHFYLEMDNPQGCLACFCSGITNQCSSSNYYREGLRPQIGADGTHNFVLTNRRLNNVISDGFIVDSKRNSVTYNRFEGVQQERESLFFQLPAKFRGDRVTSYGGYLRFTLEFSARPDGSMYRDVDLEIISAGQSLRIYYLFEPALVAGKTQTYEILLRESSFNDLRTNTAPTRETFMTLLSNVEGILIRATYHQKMASVTLRDVSMDTAIPTPTGLGGAPMVEDCRCPEGYTGLSCQRCADGYLRVSEGRDGLGRCVRCNCNKHANSCDPVSGRCLNCQHNTEGDRCDRCAAGYYGDATSGTPTDCRPCPCPLATAPNQFSPTCFLAEDRQVTCDRCPVGYTGRQCAQCAEGYVGTPSQPGGSCRPQNQDRRPEVVVTPLRLDEPEGSTVIFQCQVSGEGPFNVVWSRLDSRQLPDRATVGPRYSMTIRNVKLEDAGRYRCTATNRHGNTRREVELRVIGGQTPLQVRIDQTRVEVEEGQSARLVCTVISSPPGEMYILSWSKQGGLMPTKAIDQNGVLVIPNVQRSDAGNYVCMGSNMNDMDEATAVIIVTEDTGQSPVARIEPRFQYVDEGAPVKFECIVTGSPTPQVEWYRGGGRSLNPEARVSGGVLTIPRAQLSDESDYYCKATNENGQTEIRTILYVKPGSLKQVTIIVRQTKYVVIAGETARLECYTEEGGERVTLFWSRQAGLPPGTQQANGVLTIPNTQPSAAGRYICTGTDTDTGKISTAEALLEVNVKQTTVAPTVTMEPEKITIPMGTTGTLRCVATGTPQPTLTWSKSREQLSPNHQVTGNILRITQATMADRGIYVCRAENSAGVAQDWTTVEVERRIRPVLDVYPSTTMRVPVGGSMMFQCRVLDGAPTPRISWARSDGLAMSGRVKVMDNGVLMITGVTSEDQGGYVCTAENDMGVVTITATLHVEGPPTISIQPSRTVYGIIGQRVTLECTAVGDPIPSVRWIEPVRSTRGDVEVEGGDDIPLVTSPGSATVEIRNLQKSDEGTYICEAVNTGGRTEDRVQLIVGQSSVGVSISGPSTLSVTEGQLVELVCTANQILNPVIRWSRREGSLPPGHSVQNGVLTLPRFRAEYVGEYICTTAVQTQTYEASVFIIVTVAPRLTISPQRITTRAGEAVQLRCTASGSGPFNIEWSRVDAQMNPTAVERDGILEIRQVSAADAGRYRCVVESSAGSSEGFAIVTVEVPPAVKVAQRDVYMESNRVASLRCDATGSPVPSVRWEKEGDQLPEQHRVQNGTLTIYNVRDEDAGRYICTASSAAGTARDYAVLHVSGGSSIDHGRDKSNVQVVNVGDRVSLECIVTGTPLPVITWSRPDRRLPADAILGDGILIIPSARIEDAGTYTCKAENQAGSVSQHVVLYVRVAGEFSRPEVTAPASARAALGDSVSLVCDAQGFPSPDITWFRKDGKEMPTDYTIVDGDLRINRVRPEDAGTYVCHAENEHGGSDRPVSLDVGALVPHFSQNPQSYIAYQPLNDVYLDFDILLSLRPESTEGMVLYNGQFEDGGGDFVCFGLNEGYPEFKFDVGSGPAIIRGNNTLGLNEWHTIKLTRNRKKGSMVVDSEPAYTGESPGYFTGLDLAGNMYLGSVPNYNNIPKVVGYREGFVGSISEVKIKGVSLDLGGEAVELVGVGQYSACKDSPCANGGRCLPANLQYGFKCLCAQGYTGARCEETGEQCYPGVCGVQGRCYNLPGRGGFRCICPLGKTGTGCLTDVSVTNPFFNSTSFISYPPMNNAPFAINIGVEFKPQSLQDGIILYEGDNEDGTGDSLALVQKDGYLEFRFDTGSGPAVVRSRNPLRVNEWTRVRASRNHREGSLTINDEQPVTGLDWSGTSPGSTIGLNLKLPLYLGGVDPTIIVSPSAGVTRGFVGCVAELSINDQRIDLLRNAVESLNVVDCGERRLCERKPCKNGATCEDLPGPTYKCLCPATHTGRNCEFELNMCLTNSPCQNGAPCSYRDDTYQCDCPQGYSGKDCQFEIKLLDNYMFGGRSYLGLSKSLLAHSRTQERQNISFTMTTTQRDGLVFWQGGALDQKLMGKDYMSVALQDGYLEYRFDMGTGPAVLKSRSRVNDGSQHRVVVDRLGRAGSISVDRDETVHGTSQGPLQMLNVNGDIYFGGLSNLAFMTDNAHSKNFEGCIGNISITGRRILLKEDAVGAYNLEACSP